MAFWNNKAEIEALHQQVKQRDKQIEALQQEQQSLQHTIHDLHDTLNSENDSKKWTSQLHNKLEDFGLSLGGFHKSLGTMALSLSAERASAVEGAETSISARNHIESVASGLNNITGQMGQSASQVQSLQGNAIKIGGFVEMISNISEQTNLLALNAAIEAARAGEHGRGFAVVADEVRTLATRAREASTQISDLVGSIQNETESASALMQRVTGDTNTFGEEVALVVSDMGKMLGLSNKMEETISASALRSFVEIAKLDHIVWKFEVYRIMMGLSQKQSSDLSLHTHCRLGKWYFEGEGVACFSELPGYREIAMPHQAVHEQGALAVDAFYKQDSTQVITALSAMENASMDVIANLEKMVKTVENDPSLICQR